MTIKQLGGVFGRNPEFNSVEANSVEANDLTISSGQAIFTVSSDNIVLSGGTPSFTITDSTGPYNHIIQAVNAELRIEAADDLRIETADQQRMRIDGTTGDVTVYKNLVIGTSGQGIDFSATAGTGTSELFDDYEEGTWDCVIKDAYTGNVGSTHTGNYTKIGKVVVITVVCSNITTVGLTAGNDIYFTGLPFSPAAVSSGSVSANDITFAGYLSAQNAGAPYFRLSETASGATKDNVLVSQITSGSSDVWVQLTYEV